MEHEEFRQVSGAYEQLQREPPSRSGLSNVKVARLLRYMNYVPQAGLIFTAYGLNEHRDAINFHQLCLWLSRLPRRCAGTRQDYGNLQPHQYATALTIAQRSDVGLSGTVGADTAWQIASAVHANRISYNDFRNVLGSLGPQPLTLDALLRALVSVVSEGWEIVQQPFPSSHQAVQPMVPTDQVLGAVRPQHNQGYVCPQQSKPVPRGWRFI